MKNRPIYLKKLIEFKDKEAIKVITGARRCGKSTLLLLFEEHLREVGVSKDKILYYNFESMTHQSIKNHQDLYSEISERVSPSGKTYLFLDEIQMVNQWEKAINSFLVDFDIDIYLTGSNAHLLSSELSTLISGRYVEIKMLPLSFKEFVDFHSFDPSVSVEQKFQKYLRYGGMPSLVEYDFNHQRIQEVLEGIFSTVVLKDVYDRNKIQNSGLLDRIILFLADNIGNTVSPNRIANVLKNEGVLQGQGKKSSHASSTIETYIEMLVKSYIFYRANRYDIKGKEILRSQQKYYVFDLGIRNLLLGYRDIDRGHILENVIYLELLRRDYQVYIGKAGSQEVDFVAQKTNGLIYFQVAETVASEETKQRELGSLMQINDHHEKILLTMDRPFETTIKGIRLVNILDFLLE